MSVILQQGEHMAKLAFLAKAMVTSLLRRLQAQTLPDGTPPIGKINPLRKMAVTFELLMGF